MNKQMWWALIIIVVILILTTLSLGAQKMAEKTCEPLCEDKNLEYVSGDGIYCVCIDENKIESSFNIQWGGNQ